MMLKKRKTLNILTLIQPYVKDDSTKMKQCQKFILDPIVGFNPAKHCFGRLFLSNTE